MTTSEVASIKNSGYRKKGHTMSEYPIIAEHNGFRLKKTPNKINPFIISAPDGFSYAAYPKIRRNNEESFVANIVTNLDIGVQLTPKEAEEIGMEIVELSQATSAFEKVINDLQGIFAPSR